MGQCATRAMRMLSVAFVLAGGLVSMSPMAQTVRDEFPLAGDWNGEWQSQGTTNHLVLHLNTTPEGKMTALLDHAEEKVSSDPAIGGSFDGTRLVLRFFYWKPNSSGDLEYKVATYEATVNETYSEMTGVWRQEDERPLRFKCVTWHAKISKPAPPTVFDGDWTGIEYEVRGIQLHFTFHLRNTEDGLTATLDCAEERFKGALASKVSYDKDSRKISITMGQAIFDGTMSADLKEMETSMTEPGFHFVIHFEKLPSAPAQAR